MGKPLRLLHVGALVLLISGVALTHGAPRAKRQAQAYLSWFYRHFPWFTQQQRMKTSSVTSTASNTSPGATDPRMSTTNTARQGPLMTPPRSTPLHTQSRFNNRGPLVAPQPTYNRYNYNYRRPANPPIRAYNSPGVKVRGPLISQRQPSFSNRVPMLNAGQRNAQLGPINPAADPVDPPDMVNGIPVTEAPEPPEPPDPTDPPEMPLLPGASGNMYRSQHLGQGYPLNPFMSAQGPAIEPTDPPDMTDPPEFPLFPNMSPSTEPPTVPVLAVPETSTSAAQLASPAIIPNNVSPFVNRPTQIKAPVSIPIQAPARPEIFHQAPVQPSIEMNAPVFQQAPPFIESLPGASATRTTPRYMQPSSFIARPGLDRTLGQVRPASTAHQSSGTANGAQGSVTTAQNAPPTASQTAPKSTAPPTKSAPPVAEQSPWVMGANIANMQPWRRMMWNRFLLSNL